MRWLAVVGLIAWTMTLGVAAYAGQRYMDWIDARDNRLHAQAMELARISAGRAVTETKNVKALLLCQDALLRRRANDGEWLEIARIDTLDYKKAVEASQLHGKAAEGYVESYCTDP